MKVVFWMNIKSHHQNSFFEECNKNIEDFKVVYYQLKDDRRIAQGWSNDFTLASYEIDVSNLDKKFNSFNLLFDDFDDYIHIIPGNGHYILKSLINYVVRNNIRWCHWSERIGGGLAKYVGYRSFFVNILVLIYRNTIYYNYLNNVKKDSYRILLQGELAFRSLGLSNTYKNKCFNLFYSISSPSFDLNIPSTKEHYFLCCANQIKRKGIDYLIKAFSRIRDSNWKLIFVGKINEKYIKLVDRLGEQKRIRFVGAVSFNDVKNYMLKCDVFVLPTLFDGWGVVLNEAASMGKPLISTDECGAAYHLIKHGKNGFRVESHSVSSLHYYMNKYVCDVNLITIHGDESLNLYNQGFTVRDNVRRLLKALQ